ncbi:helix-turn-helix domain-containing protein [Lacrimispora indolis]|uniref:helix-turn-helix domain-containing protein n=1 Tax=Lacrimispora indolis TaxID=69825 RepID=UPI00048953C0|nr:AraC family transcriptional regulator [Lacrimispora indolis]
MEIKINDYYGPEHFKAINEDNYNVSRTCEYEKNAMHHIHNSSEILIIETGSADYYISGQKYHVEKNDILVIGAMEHHQSKILQPPYSRYGFTIKPSYCRSLNLEDDLMQVFSTPAPELFESHYKNLNPDIIHQIIELLCYLKNEVEFNESFRPQMERSIITQIAVLLFRAFETKKRGRVLSVMNERMLEIKEYINLHYQEKIDLQRLRDLFFLHPSTISKEFKRCCGMTLVKYINTVRVCEAAKLLESSQYSISLISDKCGYENVNTFLRHFKSIMQVSPLQYRKSVQEFFEKKEYFRPNDLK